MDFRLSADVRPSQQDDARGRLGGRASGRYLLASPTTVCSGTSEVQRSIIATRGLGLPR